MIAGLIGVAGFGVSLLLDGLMNRLIFEKPGYTLLILYYPALGPFLYSLIHVLHILRFLFFGYNPVYPNLSIDEIHQNFAFYYNRHNNLYVPRIFLYCSSRRRTWNDLDQHCVDSHSISIRCYQHLLPTYYKKSLTLLMNKVTKVPLYHFYVG